MSALVTLGFMVVFGVIGVTVSAGGRGILQFFPWSSLVIGVGLIVLLTKSLFSDQKSAVLKPVIDQVSSGSH